MVHSSDTQRPCLATVGAVPARRPGRCVYPRVGLAKTRNPDPDQPQQSQRGPVNWTGDSYPTEAKPELGDTWNGRSLQRPTPELQDPQPESNHTPPQPGEQLGGTPIIPSDTAIYDSVRQQGIPGLPDPQ